MVRDVCWLWHGTCAGCGTGCVLAPAWDVCWLWYGMCAGSGTGRVLAVVLTEAVLQQVGELGVPVRDVCLLAAQRVDHVAQARQRLVDVLRLLEPRSIRA